MVLRLDCLLKRMMEIRTGDTMAEIVIISSFGKQIAKPFGTYSAETIVEEEQIINSPEANSDEQEETEVAEESAA